jgi:hypothetical protein
MVSKIRFQPAVTVNYRPVLSSERALQNNKPATVERNFQEGILVTDPDECLIPRWTGRLTVGRNLTSTSISLR